MEKKRYLFVTYKMSDGGAERVISHLANELIRQGNEVGIFIYVRTCKEYYLHPKIAIYSINYDNLGENKIMRGVNRIVLIRKAIKEFKPDYIVPFLDSMVYESYFAAKGLRIPLIATMRNVPKSEGVIKNILLFCAFKNCAAIWLQTESQRIYLNKKNRRKAFVCPNPVSQYVIECGKKHTYQNEILNFVTLGRLVEQKNHKMLINAVIKAHSAVPDLRLKIYGIGPEEDNLRTVICDNHAENYIFLMGRTENVLQVLDEADCFVLSSDYEGMPNALMEAMGIGLPCISTDCPTGPKELLSAQKENKYGVLVPVNNSETMCDAILYMVNNPKKAINCGKEARQFISDFFSEEIITNIFSLECGKLG